ncbi:MAG TPA: ectonucleotide pyrophosphatase/phosphodiesterase [Pyrinomonadaceae bacterium]|nr:ectonucleotide pyrophosphatase/phosphodiesterase [Pyrinomonadaceae bacterium]
MRKTFVILVILLSLFSTIFSQKPIKDLKPTVILIALDGYRYDYLEKYKPPVLNELARNGVRAKWLIPSFPTKTFPNHYTVATGLYPDNHGIVENNMYDKNFDAEFRLSERDAVTDKRWWGGEPVWVTAEKQGQRAASFFFPGTEADISGVRPTYFKEYNGRVPNELRVDTILSWLDLPQEKRPTMLTLYFSLIDDAGHEFSGDAVETRYEVQNIDRVIGRLIDGLKARKIDKQANLIFFSDHGMATYRRRDAIILDEMFNVNSAERVFWVGEMVQIFPKAGKEDEIYNAIKSKLPAKAKIYRKAELPARYKFGSHPRIAPLLVLADEGVVLTTRKSYDQWKKEGGLDNPRGGHGYDNQLESMRATFIAHGAAFKRGAVVEPFENVHIYNLMTKILGLRPAKNDGDFEKVKGFLK